MKKYIMTTVLALFMGMTMSAQSDGFFAFSDYSNRNSSNEFGTLPATPTSHGSTENQRALPLGSGLLLLGGMALAYGLRKKNS